MYNALLTLVLFFSFMTLPAHALSLRLSGPPIAESAPMLAMAQSERAWEQNFDVEFIPWHSPDMLRAMVAGGQVDATLITTTAASLLRSKGVNCRVPLLLEPPAWIVSAKPGPNAMASLEGTMLLPFGPGEMPELFYKTITALSPPSLETRYTGSPMEAVNLLLAGKGDHIVLSEPTASLAVLRSKAMQAKGAPLLVKRVDLCKEWQAVYPGHRLASSCIAFFGAKADDSKQLKAFAAAYAKASRWVRKNPEKVLALALEKFPALAAQLKQGGISGFDVSILSGEQARTDALFYLEKINAISPAAIGGSMPGEDLFEVIP